ncbi:MAG TPA: hypothetical protein DEP05_04095 [Betaproteobacteria bacterium]|nr:hypothetical protein [Betaproteobacteria bacterium]
MTTTFGTPHTPSGNSFYPAYDSLERIAYVPTVAGVTYLLNPRTLRTVGHFNSLSGGRVARVTPNNRMLLVLSGKKLAAYSTGSGHSRLFILPVGGNAIALSPDGRFAFVGGNMSAHLTEIRLPAGRIVHKFPIKRSGDLVWAHGQVFSANMKTGVVSVLNPHTGKIVAIPTPEKDPAFSYRNILGAAAGIMQLAVSPDGLKVYGAGFSGHILVLSARDDAYLGGIPVAANANGPNRLSGLAVVNHGKDAVTTIENLKETVVIRLSDGNILRVLQNTAANRWVATGP